VPVIPALSLPLLSWTRERKYNKKLVHRDKDMEMAQQLLSRTKQIELGKKRKV